MSIRGKLLYKLSYMSAEGWNTKQDREAEDMLDTILGFFNVL
jgi:hypothetical protein